MKRLRYPPDIALIRIAAFSIRVDKALVAFAFQVIAQLIAMRIERTRVGIAQLRHRAADAVRHFKPIATFARDVVTFSDALGVLGTKERFARVLGTNWLADKFKFAISSIFVNCFKTFRRIRNN